MTITPCPNCNSSRLYRTVKDVSSGGGHAPNYLPGLGKRFGSAKFRVVVCHECGLTRWFATDESREKLGDAKQWESI